MIRLIQKVELDAIKEFQKICKENNIDFFLRGGSVLGAVKYDGFIPWDDDMDIAVPREGYDRLPEIFNIATLCIVTFLAYSFWKTKENVWTCHEIQI